MQIWTSSKKRLPGSKRRFSASLPNSSVTLLQPRLRPRTKLRSGQPVLPRRQSKKPLHHHRASTCRHQYSCPHPYRFRSQRKSLSRSQKSGGRRLPRFLHLPRQLFPRARQHQSRPRLRSQGRFCPPRRKRPPTPRPPRRLFLRSLRCRSRRGRNHPHRTPLRPHLIRPHWFLPRLRRASLLRRHPRPSVSPQRSLLSNSG